MRRSRTAGTGFKRALSAAGMVSLFLVPVCAGDWPDNPEGVSASFGAARKEGFLPGLEFSSDGQRVQSWSAGEIIWSSGSDFMDGALPTGGIVVIEHPDGFRSIYQNVEARPDARDHVSEDQWIGYAGSGSWMFGVRDSEMAKVIDPLTLLPARENLESPRLGEVTIASSRDSQPVVSGMEIDSGRWTILLDTRYLGDERAIPSEISLYWVGEQIGLIRFDSLEERDGHILIDAPEPVYFDSVYDGEGRLAFRDILLNAGRGILDLRISDESGRVIRKTWNLTIRGN